MRIVSCKVNHLTNPIGYDLGQPVFSWIVEEAKGRKATVSRLLIRSGSETVADTGWAALNSLSARVAFSLIPRTRYTWTVSVRTDAGDENTSEENWFETGRMDEAWTGRWIGCDDSEPRHPVFSKEIQPQKPVSSARLYICGLGLYEARWN